MQVTKRRMRNAMRGAYWVDLTLWIGLLLMIALPAKAQQRVPTAHIGYVYPAGGRQGNTFDVTVGGQLLGGVTGARITGTGVHVTFSSFDRPLSQREVLLLRDKLQEAQKKLAGEGAATRRLAPLRNPFAMARLAQEAGITDEQLRKLAEFQRLRSDPKRQLNPQLEEKVALHVVVDPDAPAGPRDLRLLTPFAATNPLRFEIGAAAERSETEPNDLTPEALSDVVLPVVLNGQILPGDVDRYRFTAHKGQRMVAAVHARTLMPYLADAVPGWFQPAITVTDAAGHEVAFADHDWFQPDPVVQWTTPADGAYVLEIRDTLYRGREDFVYRLTLADAPEAASAPAPISAEGLPLRPEKEPNNQPAQAQRVGVPCVVNGRIDRPGDVDVYRIEGHAGQEIVAEVTARRVGSPLDSFLQLTDSHGKVIAANDDCEDRCAGLLTHQADSRIAARLPAHGAYFISIRDTQQKGGPEYVYGLRISAPRPDFELRVVPSSISARAGTVVPVTVYAIRRDSFDGDIALELKGAPPGFALSGAWIPAGQDHVRLTLAAPFVGTGEPIPLSLQGSATITGRAIRHDACASEDMMQAFAYHHLVTSEEWLVVVSGRTRPGTIVRLQQSSPARVPVGGKARVGLVGPAASAVAKLIVSLSEPPEGIAIEGPSVDAGGVYLTIRTDAAKVKPGTKGNLLVETYTEYTPAARPGVPSGTKRRALVGTLPAIPFEVVRPE